MAHPSTRTHSRTILYVAPTEDVAHDGAAALERAATESAPDREPTIHPLRSLDRLRERVDEADCVVCETVTDESAPMLSLLEVAAACAETPLVLVTDASYTSAVTRSAKGIDGYVRRNTADTAAHLADEIDRVCHESSDEGEDSDAGTETDRGETNRGEGDDGAETNAEADPDPDPNPTVNDRPEATLLDATTAIVDCRDREQLFERLVDGAVDVLGFDHCWLSTVHFGELVPRAIAPAVHGTELDSEPVQGPLGEAYRTGKPVLIDDLTTREDVAPPFSDARSLCSLPVGDVGVLRVAATAPGAIDERDVDVLEGLCTAAAAVLERNWDEMGVINERNRLKREYERVERERDQFAAIAEQLADERDRLAIERDQVLGLVEEISKPTIRYEIVDGEAVIRDVNAAVETVFGDDRGAIAGDPVDEYVVPDGLETRAATLGEALRADEQHQLLDRRETVDGMRDFMLTIVPLERTVATEGGGDAPDAAADHEGLLVYKDITESKRRELELAAATERLERIARLVEEDVEKPLQTARSYLELAEKTGEDEHFEVIEAAHERVRDRLAAVEKVATWDDGTDGIEPIALHDVATHAWAGIDTGNARLVTEDDLILEADREQLRELFEYVLETAIEVDDTDEVDDAVETAAAGEDGADASPSEAVSDSDGDAANSGDDSPITITVGATEDGFYVAGDRPAASESEDGRQEAPTPGRLTASDGAGLQLGLVERIATDHGWDVGVAEDEDGTAFAFRGVDAISVNRNRV